MKTSVAVIYTGNLAEVVSVSSDGTYPLRVLHNNSMYKLAGFLPNHQHIAKYIQE